MSNYMRHCQHCNHVLRKHEWFCPRCGARVNPIKDSRHA